MTVKELKEILNTYSDEQFVHIRVWMKSNYNEINFDTVVDKVQQGTDGAALITGTIK